MAWAAIENFNSYSDGDVAGETGGSGWAAEWINAATQIMSVAAFSFEGAKGLLTNHASSNTFYYRVLTSAVSGNGNILYFTMRKSLNNSGSVSCGLRSGGPPGNNRVSVEMDSSGNIGLGGATSVTLVTGYSVDTWYAIRLTVNVTANTATAAYSTNGTFSSESSAVTMNSTGDITNFQIQSDPNAGTSYVDNIGTSVTFPTISATDTAGAPTDSAVLSQVVTLSDTSGVPTEVFDYDFGWGNQTKSSTSNFVNLDKS